MLCEIIVIIIAQVNNDSLQ